MSPCYECSRREIGCHDTCKDYKKYRDRLDLINKGRQSQGDNIGYERDKYLRLKKR